MMVSHLERKHSCWTKFGEWKGDDSIYTASFWGKFLFQGQKLAVTLKWGCRSYSFFGSTNFYPIGLIFPKGSLLALQQRLAKRSENQIDSTAATFFIKKIYKLFASLSILKSANWCKLSVCVFLVGQPVSQEKPKLLFRKFGSMPPRAGWGTVFQWFVFFKGGHSNSSNHQQSAIPNSL